MKWFPIFVSGRTFFTFILLACLLITAACNMTGYSDIAEPVNRFTPFGETSSAFFRSYETEEGSTAELFIISDPNGPMGDCALMRAHDNTTRIDTEFQLGTYEFSEDQIDIEFSVGYNYTYKKVSNPAGISGASKQDFSPVRIWKVSWEWNDSGSILLDGHPYWSIQSVLEKILSRQSPEWPIRLTQLLILNTMTTHTRIIGFGGIGMLLYIDKTTRFEGLLSGILDFKVDGLQQIKSEFKYNDHSDLSGIILDGSIISESTMDGNGIMSGGIFFILQGSSDSWSGSLDYSEIVVSQTLPSSGFYTLTLGGESFQIDFSAGNPGSFNFGDFVVAD